MHRLRNSKRKKSVDEQTEELKKFEKYVDTDEYVEKIARERLGLVYKGEIIFEPDDCQVNSDHIKLNVKDCLFMI